jgi:lysyl-tRNA synthetase class 2
MKWQPTASNETLQLRAAILSDIRQFFANRNVLEVDTPLMSHGTITDPYVTGIPATFKTLGTDNETICYLQTSPEYAMKRLLAAGSGPIYQLCKAFRQGDVGRLHNPEFTMLEWYRPGFDHHQLMDEMDALLQRILKKPVAERVTYAEIFYRELAIDPHTIGVDALQKVALSQDIHLVTPLKTVNAYLDLLWTHIIEPRVGLERPLFIYDFPASQASLAKVRDTTPPLASRFEVYFGGVELANGFHELQNWQEQEQRFKGDLEYRAENGLPPLPMDKRLLHALKQGIPDCAGVALGVDRLIMLALQYTQLAKVLSFDFERA